MITAVANTSFEATAQFPTGLTLGVRITDNQGATTTARTTVGITEYPAGSGLYAITLTAPAAAGQYSVVWDDGTNYASDDLEVSAAAGVAGTVTPHAGSNYVTLEELKNSQELTGVSFADYDAMKAIGAASRAVENITGRPTFGTSIGTRYYSPYDPGYLAIDDFLGGAVATDNDRDGIFETSWTLNTDYVLEPLNAPNRSWPYEDIRVHPLGSRRFSCWMPRSVSVAGTFGWASLPEGVYAATMIIAVQTVKFLREAPFGVVGMGLDNVAVRISRSNPQVAMHLDPYVRDGGGVLVA